MAALQCYRNCLTNGDMHTAVLNPQGSKQFLKKIVPTSVAFILHQRIDLDENDFETRTYAGIHYKVFKPKIKNPVLQNVCNWVKGALHALEKNYLREMYLILASADDPAKVFESYKFQFEYMGDDVFRLDRPATKQELRQSTVGLLKAIHSLNELTKYKETELNLQMALTYYQDVTPPDYNPPFYISEAESTGTKLRSLQGHSDDYLFLGVLKTGHHVVKCRGQGDVFSTNQSVSSSSMLAETEMEADDNLELDEMVLKDKEDGNTDGILQQYDSESQNSNETERPNGHETELQSGCETELQNGHQNELQNTVVQNNQSAGEFDRCNTSTTANVSEREILYVFDNEVRCLCKLSLCFNYMAQFMCTQCSTYQHCACVGYLYQSDMPDQYVCPQCSQGIGTPMQEHQKQLLCIYRLTVAMAYFREAFPREVIDILPLDMKRAMWQKMVLEKFLKVEEDGEHSLNMTWLKNTHIKTVFFNSFSRKRKMISDSMTLGDPNSVQKPHQKKGRY